MGTAATEYSGAISSTEEIIADPRVREVYLGAGFTLA